MSREKRDREILGANIAQRRRALGLTQERLAHSAGIGRSTLSSIENGSANPRHNILSRIAESLDIPLSILQADPKDLSEGGNYDYYFLRGK